MLDAGRGEEETVTESIEDITHDINERLDELTANLAQYSREEYEAGEIDRPTYVQRMVDLGIWRRSSPEPGVDVEPSGIVRKLAGWLVLAGLGLVSVLGPLLFFTLFQLMAGWELDRTFLGRLF